MYPNKKKSGETLEKVPKLKINTSAKPIEIPYIEPPLTARQELYDLQDSRRNFEIDNHTLYNKLLDVQNEIRELRNIINSLHFPKPVKYSYPSSSSYSPGTMYCTPPLDTTLKQYFNKSPLEKTESSFWERS
jgi:hypothetical protein